jgi:hypothetical protein
MKHFVNYRKRGVQLPKGCKDLSDLLKSAKKPENSGKKSLGSNHKSKCEYCGAPAVAGWGSGVWIADGTWSEETHAWCERCDDDLREFKARPENRLPELPADFDFEDPISAKTLEQWTRLAGEIREREAAFMRQKVAERKGLG